MKNKNPLTVLNPTELLFLHKHLKLGKEHLQRLLTEEELKILFQLATVPAEVQQELAMDAPELAGQSALLINTIMTATLGGWMGVSGFLGLRLSSKTLFFSVLAFSVTVGAFIGLQNARLTKKTATKAIEKRKLQDLELSMVREIVSQRRKEIEDKNQELAEILKNLEIDAKIQEINKDANLQELCLGWLEQLSQKVKRDVWEKMREEFAHKVAIEDQKKEVKRNFGQIFQKLSHSLAQPPLAFTSWLRARFRSLFVQLIPTLLGGFSSLFVYLGGIPNLAREFGQQHLFEFLSQPKIKAIELLISFCITFYFGFSFIYMNRKSFQREQEIEKMQTLITREENVIDLLDDQLLKVKEVLDVMRQMSKAKKGE